MFVVIPVAALLCCASGCSHGPAPVANSVAPAVPAASDTSVVTLSPAALKEGGIRTEVVSPVAMSGDVVATGQVVPNEDRTFKVGAHVSGRIGAIEVNLGDRVTKGQVVVRVHSHEIHDTRGAYLVAREAVRQAQDRAALAQRVRDRARRLLALEAISREQADQAETESNASLAAVDSAKAQLESERTHLVEVLEVPIDQQGIPQDVETVPVRAPAAGVVIERKATVGAVASAGDVLLSITDPSSLWVIANVNEAELSTLHPGQLVKVQVRAYPNRSFRGRVEKLGESLDPATRTLQVRVSVPNQEGLLKPEMFAEVAIERAKTTEAITVPRNAVQDLNGRASVFVESSPSQFRALPIAVGQSVGDRVQVVSGLNAGDRVVIEGGFGLKSEMLKGSGANQ